jgi:hypothetical protein
METAINYWNLSKFKTLINYRTKNENPNHYYFTEVEKMLPANSCSTWQNQLIWEWQSSITPVWYFLRIDLMGTMLFCNRTLLNPKIALLFPNWFYVKLRMNHLIINWLCHLRNEIRRVRDLWYESVFSLSKIRNNGGVCAAAPAYAIKGILELGFVYYETNFFLFRFLGSKLHWDVI